MPFGVLILAPDEKMMPENIRALRLRDSANQAMFARNLSVTIGLVSK